METNVEILSVRQYKTMTCTIINNTKINPLTLDTIHSYNLLAFLNPSQLPLNE